MNELLIYILPGAGKMRFIYRVFFCEGPSAHEVRSKKAEVNKTAFAQPKGGKIFTTCR